VTWAQRKGRILLSVVLGEVRDPEIKVEAEKLHFKAVGGAEKKVHEFSINFFKEIDPEAIYLFVLKYYFKMSIF
jgi:hypothetical protein